MGGSRIRGAGGTEGGTGRFLIGLVMLVVGGYLFLDAVQVRSGFGWGYSLYNVGSLRITTGYVLIPLVFGIALIFFNARNRLAWALAIGSLAILVFGVIASLRFKFAPMSAFSLILTFVLFFGGLGLFLSSLRDYRKMEQEKEARALELEKVRLELLRREQDGDSALLAEKRRLLGGVEGSDADDRRPDPD